MDCESEACILGLVLLLNSDMTLISQLSLHVKPSSVSLRVKLSHWIIESLSFYNLLFHFYRGKMMKCFYFILHTMKWNENCLIQ